MRTALKESPESEVVVFDGDCEFCRRQVGRIKSLNGGGRFRYMARQEAGLLEEFPQLAEYDEVEGLRFVDGWGKVWIGADAVYEIYRRLKFFGMIAWVYRVPLIHQFCRMVYSLIARNRRRLSRRCDSSSCSRSDV